MMTILSQLDLLWLVGVGLHTLKRLLLRLHQLFQQLRLRMKRFIKKLLKKFKLKRTCKNKELSGDQRGRGEDLMGLHQILVVDTKDPLIYEETVQIR